METANPSRKHIIHEMPFSSNQLALVESRLRKDKKGDKVSFKQVQNGSTVYTLIYAIHVFTSFFTGKRTQYLSAKMAKKMRHNIFNCMHKALQGMLYESSALLQKSDFTDFNERSMALLKVNQTIAFFEDYIRHGKVHLLPLVKNHSSNEFERLSLFYSNTLNYLNRLEHITQFASWEGCEAEMITSAGELTLNFIGFVTQNIEGIYLQETLTNEILQAYLDDQELLAIERSMTSSLPQAIKIALSKQMVKSLNSKDLSHWSQTVTF